MTNNIPLFVYFHFRKEFALASEFSQLSPEFISQTASVAGWKLVECVKGEALLAKIQNRPLPAVYGDMYKISRIALSVCDSLMKAKGAERTIWPVTFYNNAGVDGISGNVTKVAWMYFWPGVPPANAARLQSVYDLKRAQYSQANLTGMNRHPIDDSLWVG